MYKILNQPKVTIGMPVYNGGAFIREALDCLLAQTFNNFELIISDNASNDDTETICREYAERDQRIRYVRQSVNLGVIANFQFVLSEGIGEYFMWATPDDRRHPLFVEYAIAVLDSDQNVGLVFCDMSVTNLLNGESQYYPIGYSGASAKWKRYLFRLTHQCPSLIYGLHRRSILQDFQIRQYDYMDVHLTHWYELNSNVKTIPLYLYSAGTNGERVPYSLTGKYVCSRALLKAERILLRKHFSPTVAIILYSLSHLIFKKNDEHVNSIIKQK
jgi:glycosyltransferase involved in cell wall biosynthesis